LIELEGFYKFWSEILKIVEKVLTILDNKWYYIIVVSNEAMESLVKNFSKSVDTICQT